MKIKNKIKITVNGKQILVTNKFSIKSLITKLKLPLNKIAIEYNKKIIDKKKISTIQLKKGDKIEIVHFIGGGWWLIKNLRYMIRFLNHV